jgi:hypothetical protein
MIWLSFTTAGSDQDAASKIVENEAGTHEFGDKESRREGEDYQETSARCLPELSSQEGPLRCVRRRFTLYELSGGQPGLHSHDWEDKSVRCMLHDKRKL